jgi:hypothetical protein
VTGSPVLRRPLFLVVTAALIGAVACTEDLSTTATCSAADAELCPEQQLTVEQAELQPVVEDTTIAGFPLRGTESRLLAARAGDTLDVRAVYRFDSLPRSYVSGTTTTPVGQVLEPVMEVIVLRRTESLVPAGTSIEAYDVDIAGDDTSTAALAAAFTPARLLGSGPLAVRPATDTTTVDTLRIALSPDRLLSKITGDSGLRVGLRVAAAGEARVRLSPTAARIAFRAVADTNVARLSQTPLSKTPVGNSQLQIDLSSFTVTVKGTPAPADPVIVVGGLPARRALLRFVVPPAIVDSSIILRATLVLTQRPVRGYLAADTLGLQPLAVVTSDVVRDVPRRMLFATNAVSPFSGRAVLGADPLPVVPADSGEFEFPIAELVGTWRTSNAVGFLPELVLAAAFEGSSPLQAHFFSAEAPDASLRPKLRLSYIRRINFSIP